MLLKGPVDRLQQHSVLRCTVEGANDAAVIESFLGHLGFLLKMFQAGPYTSMRCVRLLILS